MPSVNAGRRTTARTTCSNILRTLMALLRLPPRTPARAGCLVHRERALRLAREELPDERVVRVQHVLGRPGLDDPALPQHVDVVGHAPRAHDVVCDHAER